MAERKWFALYTKSRWEKRAYQQLVEKGIETYLPLEKRLKQWSDRRKWVEEPLIRSYIFVKTTEHDLQQALNTPGIVTVIRFSGRPAPVQEKEIALIRSVLSSEEEFEVTGDAFALGQKVCVDHGTLKGLEGELVQHLRRERRRR